MAISVSILSALCVPPAFGTSLPRGSTCASVRGRGFANGPRIMSKRELEVPASRPGIRQRLALADLASRAAASSGPAKNDGITSQMVLYLIKEWSWGHLSATKLQVIARKAYEDQVQILRRLGISEDCVDDTLKRIASLGSSGKHPGNCHSELLRFLGEPSTPSPMMHPIPIKREKISSAHPEEIVQVHQPFFLPHVLFSFYFHNDKARFQELFLGPYQNKDDIAAFWSELERRGDPRLANHPVKTGNGWQRRTIPLAFHGDGVPVLQVGKANTKSMEVYSIQSLFPAGLSTLKCKILLTQFFVSNAVENTHQEIWKILNWSLYWLGKGRWPATDWEGKAWPANSSEATLANKKVLLADGYQAILYSIKGDLDFYAKTLHLRHYNADHMCDLCPASRSGHRTYAYNNFSEDAVWKKQLHTTTEWQAIYNGQAPHPIFELPGVTHFCIEPDELHVLYLGTVQYLLGSVLFLLTFVIMPESPEENMSALWKKIVDYYKTFSVATQYSTLQLSSFCAPTKPTEHYPKLKGKGAEVKDLVAPLCAIWKDITKSRKDSYKMVSTCLENQVAIQDIMHGYKDDLILPVNVAKNLQQHVDALLVTYQRLAAKADQAGHLLWNQPTKWHWLWHLAQRSVYINPRRTNTFMDEDFVGKQKDVVHSCAAGSELHDMAIKGAHKYRWGFHFLGSRFG